MITFVCSQHKSHCVILFTLQHISINNTILYLFNNASGIDLACLLLRILKLLIFYIYMHTVIHVWHPHFPLV